ncbi:ABC transporter permease [Halopenitus persicus]|uniref:ABC transporter permease n=1 Tax=Halopenitus persicus TaxID=1048396 RepID=UPI000BBADE0F|nr:ABC transporter permease [Halopenitus persicus]
MSAFNALEGFIHRHGDRIGRGLMVLILTLIWIPIGVVVLMSFAGEGVLSFPPETYTVRWYAEVLNNDDAISATLTSLRVSFVATPITVLISLLAAYGVARYDFRGKNALQALLTLPIIVPLVVTGVAMTLFFGNINLSSGFTTVVIAHIVRTVPFAALIIIPTVIGFDRTLEEASKDLGASELRTFRRVTLPNIMPGVIAGGLLAFTVSFNEFVYTYFVRDTATQTLPVYLWGLIRYGFSPEVNVISVLFLLLAAAILLVAVSLTGLKQVILRG